MGNLSSKTSSKKQPKGPVITEVDKAILSLKTQKRKLEEQEKLIHARIDRHQEVARSLLKEGRKDRALLVLKRKKLCEGQAHDLQATLLNLEGVLSSIETSKQQTRIFSALKEGAKALKVLQAQVNLEDVQVLMEETQQAAEYQAELRSLLEGSTAHLSEEQQQQVDEEMCMLEDMVAMGEQEALPSVPTTRPMQVPSETPAELQHRTRLVEPPQTEEEVLPSRVALIAT